MAKAFVPLRKVGPKANRDIDGRRHVSSRIGVIDSAFATLM